MNKNTELKYQNRCPKARFTSKSEAKKAIKRINKISSNNNPNTKKLTYSYFCDTCDCYHNTSNDKVEGRKRRYNIEVFKKTEMYEITKGKSVLRLFEEDEDQYTLFSSEIRNEVYVSFSGRLSKVLIINPKNPLFPPETYKAFDLVRIKNSATKRTSIYEYRSTFPGAGRPEWGAETNEHCYVIVLGKKVWDSE